MEHLEPLEHRRVLSRDPPNAEAAEGAFAHLLTPAAMRFVRCNFPVPRLDEAHQLEIAGEVSQAGRLPLAHLKTLPSVTLTVVTECAGNGRARIEPPVDGDPWRNGAVSVAQWTGVPLRSVLALKDTAVEVVFTGADGGAYQRSLPREIAMDPATLVAWEMNGTPIPARFGGPLRLVVPGWYGMASVKWLARIEAVTEPFRGHFQAERYVYGPSVPVTRIRVKSMFTDVPEAPRAGLPTRVTGLAWGGEGVARVEVGIDGEWNEARLVGPILPHAWRRFELHWTPPAPGRYRLCCRALGAHGETQPRNPLWNPLGYGANGIETRDVVAR